MTEAISIYGLMPPKSRRSPPPKPEPEPDFNQPGAPLDDASANRRAPPQGAKAFAYPGAAGAAAAGKDNTPARTAPAMPPAAPRAAGVAPVAAAGGAAVPALRKGPQAPPPQQPHQQPKPAPKPKPQGPVIPETALERARRDAKRWRLQKTISIAFRFAIFVILPTLLTAYYLYFWAWLKSPFYEAESVFTIQTSETSSVPTIETVMGPIVGNADAQDAVTIQEFILSRNTMLRLNEDEGVLDHFKDPAIDPLRRLSEHASEEAELDYYLSVVQVIFDPIDKVLTLKTQAADPEYAQRINRRLIDYSEQKVNEISGRIRGDQLETAQRELDAKQAELGAARQELLRLQQQFGEPDPFSVLQSIIVNKAELEQALALKRAELTSYESRGGGATNAAIKLRSEVAALEQEIRTLENAMVSRGPELAEFERAMFEKEASQEFWTLALGTYEQARLEALRKHLYLAVVNEPLAPRDPRYPRVLKLTLLTLLGCFLLYNILVLIGAAIREHARL